MSHTENGTRPTEKELALAAADIVSTAEYPDNAQATPQKNVAPHAANIYKPLTYMSLDEFEKPKKLDWLVHNLIPMRGLVMLYGVSSGGKTFILIALAMCFATGRPFMGLATKKRKVVYVYLESPDSAWIRFAAWRVGNEFYEKLGTQIEFVTSNFSLTEWGMQYATDIANHAGEGGIVIIDTLHMASPGIDENSSQDAGKVQSVLRKIEEITNAPVITVHHSNKSEEGGLRGSGAWFADADVVLKVRPYKDKKSGVKINSDEVRVLEVRKSRNSPNLTDYYFSLEPVDVEDKDHNLVQAAYCKQQERPTEKNIDYRPKRETARVKYTKIALHELQSLSETMMNGEVPFEAWRNSFYKSMSLEGTTVKQDTLKHRFADARQDLKDEGYIKDVYLPTFRLLDPSQERTAAVTEAAEYDF